MPSVGRSACWKGREPARPRRREIRSPPTVKACVPMEGSRPDSLRSPQSLLPGPSALHRSRAPPGGQVRIRHKGIHSWAPRSACLSVRGPVLLHRRRTGRAAIRSLAYRNRQSPADRQRLSRLPLKPRLPVCLIAQPSPVLRQGRRLLFQNRGQVRQVPRPTCLGAPGPARRRRRKA